MEKGQSRIVQNQTIVPSEPVDLVVLGSGVAGLAAALLALTLRAPFLAVVVAAAGTAAVLHALGLG